MEYARTGDVAANISSPSAWICKTCHGIHKTFEEEDYALRLSDPVKFIFDETVIFDAGSSNLCANCHQSRRAGPYDMGGEMVDLDDDDVDETEVPDGHFFISSTHYGPHHGAQANVLIGAGFAEITGSKSYPAAGSGAHFTGGCTGCHMGEYSDGLGGHSWNPVTCDACHPSADADYDFMGTMDANEAKLETLRDLLAAAEVIEYVEEDEAWEPIVGIYPVVQAEAFFNWIGLEEDRSMGVHNPGYVGALLDNTIEAMQAN
jgi:hypothetical protein